MTGIVICLVRFSLSREFTALGCLYSYIVYNKSFINPKVYIFV